MLATRAPADGGISGAITTAMGTRIMSAPMDRVLSTGMDGRATVGARHLGMGGTARADGIPIHGGTRIQIGIAGRSTARMRRL